MVNETDPDRNQERMLLTSSNEMVRRKLLNSARTMGAFNRPKKAGRKDSYELQPETNQAGAGPRA